MMKKNKRWLALAVSSYLSVYTALGAAQEMAPLSEAQRAYAAVDYEATRGLARDAVERGGNDRQTTAELYLLWATAAAALDQGEEARLAFSFALAANPQLKLDRNVSPKIRGPYQEARGSASSADGKPPLGLELRRTQQGLQVLLRDRLNVAARILLAAREQDADHFTQRRLDAAPTLLVPLARGKDLQAYVQVLDRHDNVLFELGRPAEPLRLRSMNAGRATRRESSHDRKPNPTPHYIAAGSLAALGLASGGVATVMFLRREAAARDWNGPGCEKPGSTRQQQCNSVNERRQQAEQLSIGFAAAGGGLLLGSLASILLAPSRAPSNLAVEAGPGNVMLRLRTTL